MSSKIYAVCLTAASMFCWTITAHGQEVSVSENNKFTQDNFTLGAEAYPQVDGQKKTRACIGEKVCPVTVQSMFPCGYTEQRAGRELCTVYKGDGSTQTLDHIIDHQGTHEGNACGYSWFLVTCFLP